MNHHSSIKQCYFVCVIDNLPEVERPAHKISCLNALSLTMSQRLSCGKSTDEAPLHSLTADLSEAVIFAARPLPRSLSYRGATDGSSNRRDATDASHGPPNRAIWLVAPITTCNATTACKINSKTIKSQKT